MPAGPAPARPLAKPAVPQPAPVAAPGTPPLPTPVAGQAIVLYRAEVPVYAVASQRLVAVNDAAPFWERHGFVVTDPPGMADKLAGYGPDAIGSALPRIMRILQAEDVRIEVGRALTRKEREYVRVQLEIGLEVPEIVAGLKA